MSNLSRRTLLRAGSTALMLPILEANVVPAFAASAPKIPQRLVWVLMGYGVNAGQWFPRQQGTDFDLPSSVKAFEDLKSDVSFLQNLTNRHIYNPHAGSASFLTCANTKQAGGVFKNTISCDQLAAQTLGNQTRHRSLAIGPNKQQSQGHDGHGGRFGYASWGADGKPVGTYRRLIDLYTALFGHGDTAEQMAYRLSRKQSSLDLLFNDAKRLNRKISSQDRDRVDEYFTSIRNIETRLSRAEDWSNRPFPKPNFRAPKATIRGKAEVEIAFDLMHAAIHSDSTRVLTYMLPTNSILKDLGFKEDSHKMSHKSSGAAHTKRDQELARQVARFVRKLKETKEIDGTCLLDHSLIAYGSGLRSGHNRSNGPMLLAGHGGGGIKQGQNIVYSSNKTPVANLWLSMLRHVGVETNRFGNSQEVLSELGFS